MGLCCKIFHKHINILWYCGYNIKVFAAKRNTIVCGAYQRKPPVEGEAPVGSNPIKPFWRKFTLSFL